MCKDSRSEVMPSIYLPMEALFSLGCRMLLALVLVAAFTSSSARPENTNCSLFRDDDHLRLDHLMKSRELAKANTLAEQLYRHYDECYKSVSSDAESQVMNRSWRADTAIMKAAICRRTSPQCDARQWIGLACQDYRVIVDAPIVDTTTRKMATQAIRKNCR